LVGADGVDRFGTGQTTGWDPCRNRRLRKMRELHGPLRLCGDRRRGDAG